MAGQRIRRRLLDRYERNRKVVNENLGLIIAVFAAGAAIWSGWIARRALAVQSEATRLEYRPYVSVRFTKASFVKPQRFADGKIMPESSGYEVAVQIASIGKTPAKNLRVQGFCDREQKGLHNGWMKAEWPLLFDDTEQLICHTNADLPDGKLPLNIVVSASVAYDDVFNERHTTSLCRILITDGVSAIGSLGCDSSKDLMD